MRFTGIIRQIDSSGRLVLPKELRRVLKIEDGNANVEFYLNKDDEIVLKKYQPCCVFCKSMIKLTQYNEYLVCNKCINKLVKLRDNPPTENEE